MSKEACQRVEGRPLECDAGRMVGRNGTPDPCPVRARNQKDSLTWRGGPQNKPRLEGTCCLDRQICSISRHPFRTLGSGDPGVRLEEDSGLGHVQHRGHGKAWQRTTLIVEALRACDHLSSSWWGAAELLLLGDVRRDAVVLERVEAEMSRYQVVIGQIACQCLVIDAPERIPE